ncbi:microvitellogenin-like [Ostrinia nubilalis]|uniref:microvitellogenin-like n=1 Tax=Ostrinia nubilalis TaxID=29057 RepID=UPI003082315F
MAASKWEVAPSPNYGVNVDKIYPYSEVPYIGKYKLVKIPQGSDLLELVDYWGEGRIDEQCGASGFPDCYNVNHPSQCVSNGADKGRKIPNRVPVQSYTNCDTSSYIKDDSVKTVTLMGAPINNSCSKDIARMVNEDHGKVIVFGFQDTSADIKNLNTDLVKKHLIRCDGYELPDTLQEVTLFSSIANNTALKLTLLSSIKNANYEQAVDIRKAFAVSSHANSIREVVNDLLHEGNSQVMSFAYKLWNGDTQRIVSKYFPLEFKLIMNEENVMIWNNRFDQALKLAVALDSDRDRRGWGANDEKKGKRVNWKIMPVWRDNRVLFKLLNVEFGMFLKLAKYEDGIHDREAWGSYGCDDEHHTWRLDPVMLNGKLMFFVVSNKYQLGLKLAVRQDSMGDRALWGHNADVHNNPGHFGWYIKAAK